MSHYKRTPISIDTSDATEYLSTKFNMASTILQSTKKTKKDLDSLIFLGSLHFADQEKNPAKSKITIPIGVQYSERISYHR